ncbi:MULTISPECIES: DUF6124 family protein [Pseudomonas]|uniref:DUF3077 domain-containing protein n=1 Tax=Pseudomonas fluorescens HK44 TaxID=1042209 RepID=A0A010TFT4_PSEFL|nr:MULTISPECIES: DUF6124 family protein [Pseudomonas]EXF95997.1 hypothetical protein HK44_021950 [Pseudomonas fluorescens HK44]POA29659.1 hypothetical protein C1887_18955 [Pseudomonas sp. GW456-R21]POA70136.1 hypothetical protein C1884_05705 [Pseudomonas sp. GW460-R15]
MFKPTPNPPETDPVSPYASLDSKELHAAAHRALDHYLVLPETKTLLADRRPGCIFVIAPDVDSETLLAHACETLASVNVMASDLAFELEGPKRNTALAIQQMISLAELAVNRALDHLDPPDSPQ